MDRELARERHAALNDVLVDRRADGFVRACHGDLHLTNLARLDGRIVAFDGIEFDPNLYWIDVISDTAFLVMDLLVRGRRDLAATFLDAWLQETGDFDGLRLLRHHLSYRTLVRAKVAAIAASQQTGDARDESLRRCDAHVRLSEAVGQHEPGALVILCGLSGSGKSTLARELVPELRALRVCSDVERKRLFGLKPGESSDSPIDGGIYTPDAHRRTYERLREGARGILASGHIALVDAVNLRREDRDRFRAIAADAGAPSVVVFADTPHDELFERVRRRADEGGDPSEAGPERQAAQPVDPGARLGFVQQLLEGVVGLELPLTPRHPQQRQLVIAQHDARPPLGMQPANAVDHVAARGAAIDQVAHQPDLEVPTEVLLRALDHGLELHGASLYVSHEDRLHRRNGNRSGDAPLPW